MLEELLECVDTNSGDYGFFNPKSLAVWNGPKKWKNRTIARSSKPRKCNIKFYKFYYPFIFIVNN